MRSALAIVVALGCGDSNDGGGDATPDAPDDPVTIRVTRQSVPLPGIAIVFQRADASIVETATTDADGRAEAKVGQGGFVTAITDFAATQDVKTFVGVSPGDQLVIDGAPNAATPMTSYTVRAEAVAGAVFYRVGVRCLVGTGETVAPATNPVDLPVTTTCLAPTETLVVAIDSLGFPIQSVLAEEATPTEGGIVDVTGAFPITAETTTITLANAPGGSLLEPARAFGAALFLAETEPATNGPHAIVFPDNVTARQTIAVTGSRPVFAWGPPDMQTIDVGALEVAAISTPAIDRNTLTVSWQGGAAANFAFGQLFVEAGSSFTWSYAGPIEPGATQLVLPPLADFSLAAATRIDLEVGVGRVDGIDELRRDGAWLDANNGIMGRQQTLFQPPATPGTAGFAYVGASVTF